MSIHEFLETKQITPAELDANFKKIKSFEIDTQTQGGCYNCKDKLNSYLLPSPPWTAVKVCNRCNTIMIAYIQDRMAGIYKDTIDVYEPK